jgi:hypothetical protein
MNFNLYAKVQINLYKKVQIVFEMRKKLTKWGIRVGTLERPEQFWNWGLGSWSWGLYVSIP